MNAENETPNNQTTPNYIPTEAELEAINEAEERVNEILEKLQSPYEKYDRKKPPVNEDERIANLIAEKDFNNRFPDLYKYWGEMCELKNEKLNSEMRRMANLTNVELTRVSYYLRIGKHTLRYWFGNRPANISEVIDQFVARHIANNAVYVCSTTVNEEDGSKHIELNLGQGRFFPALASAYIASYIYSQEDGTPLHIVMNCDFKSDWDGVADKISTIINNPEFKDIEEFKVRILKEPSEE